MGATQLRTDDAAPLPADQAIELRFKGEPLASCLRRCRSLFVLCRLVSVCCWRAGIVAMARFWRCVISVSPAAPSQGVSGPRGANRAHAVHIAIAITQAIERNEGGP